MLVLVTSGNARAFRGGTGSRESSHVFFILPLVHNINTNLRNWPNGGLIGRRRIIMRLNQLLCLAAFVFATNVHAQDLKILVNKKGKVGYADRNGNEIIKCQYESAQPFSEGVAIVTKSGKSGVIDATGKVLLPLKYSQILSWNKELYLIKDGKKMGLADHLGKVVLPAKYSHISKPNCFGKALIALGGKATSNEKKTYMANAKYGIIDIRGNVIVAPKYKGLYEFSYDGKDKYPYYEGKRLEYSYHYTVDTLITDCSYLGFSNNGLSVYNAGIIEGNGKEILKTGIYYLVMQPQSNMTRYYIPKKKQTLCGYHNLLTKKGFQVASFNNPIDDIKFWTHGDFIGDMAPVNGTSWSFIDKTGKSLRTGYTSLKHSQVAGLWAAKNNSGKWEVFDNDNNTVGTLSNYDEIGFPTQKDDKLIFAVKKLDKYGAISRDGETVIPFEYDAISANTYDVMAVKKNGKWGALSVENKVLFPIEYIGFILPEEKNSQHFWVQQSDSLYYHLNLNNNNISANGFKRVSNFKDGIAFVIPDGFIVPQNTVNKAQLYTPNTAYNIMYGTSITTNSKNKGKTITTQTTETKNPFTGENFGFLLNSDNTLLLGKPVSILYKDIVIKEIKKYGNRALTDSETKNVLLRVTQENRIYSVKDTLDDEEWNF